MPRYHHPLPFGAEVQPGGRTRFRLWAPDAECVSVVRREPDEACFELQAEDDGWFAATVPVAAGASYVYRIAEEFEVPDPAARFAPQGVAGPSAVVDARDYEWQAIDWCGRPWHEAVLYELHVGTFTEEGTFAAAIPRLAQLAELGINTLELMPVAAFPGMRGWGYDGVLPFAPHHAYGRPEDLKRFIEAAHAAGISVVLDVVYNHFGPEGNFLHRYAGAFFTERYQTPWGAAIDFEGDRGRTVRQFFIQNALYWLQEYRFDGLRVDAVHAIKDASRTHFIDELATAIEAGPERERHIHLILENHDNQASRLLPAREPRLSKAQWNDDFHHCLHVLLTGERDGYYADYAAAPREQLARVLGEGFAFQGDPYGESRQPRGEISRELPVSAFVDFLQNHDQIGNRALGERLVALTDMAALRAGLAILLLSPHIPMLFMGEEYGARQPFLYFCDYRGELAEAITRGRRDEFAAFDAFASGRARERIPDPNALATFERSRLRWQDREQSPHREHLTWVRELLRLRAEHVTPLIPLIPPGSAHATVAATTVTVQWPAGATILQLEANLAAERGVRAMRQGARLLYATEKSPCEDTLAAWEVRLSRRRAGG